MTKADFSHLNKLSIKSAATTTYEIVEVDGAPILTGVFAGETNKPFYNALLKRSARNARRFKANKMTSKELQDNRNHDRELYPEYVITGWSGVVDNHGNEAEFTKENCALFVSALPDWIFDDVRNFFANPESFITRDETEVATEEDAVDLGN